MDNYINSTTWQKTVGLKCENMSIQECIDDLRKSYFSIRGKASCLATEIARFLPNYTVHDISHIDALWESTDIILPEMYEINPVEGYVLGIAFLVHDLGMGLVAYTNGEEDIKQLSLWKDIVAAEFVKKYERKIERKDWKCLDTEIESVAKENVLRKLHAEQAKKLPTLEWEFEGKREYLIDNTILREAYGEIIGLIAYSHWWDIDRVKKEFQNKYLGAISMFPKEWTVDVIKLSCILRIADAIQIDDRRAPIFLMKLRKPKEVSKIHWIFQNKLYQPIVKNERILFTSKSSFSINEMEAWWTCYDTLKMIDKELRVVDRLLVESDHKQFSVTGVGGISNPKELANNVLVNEWTPVDTSIRVGDVGKLVSNLGGTQLYGYNSLAPLRELIQNGGDAIRARKLLEDDEEYTGNITISFYKEENHNIIQIDDNGIGMSQNVLLGPFLDFGESFWNTELMYDELPGLSSLGFSSTGQYGIGFYSVFIWSSDVTVITKKYDAAREDTLVLEFKRGTESRPILRKARKSEQIKDGGTTIKVRIQFDLIQQLRQYNVIEESIDNTIAKFFPCLDCNLWINDGEKRLIEGANDWLKIPTIEFIKRIVGPNAYKQIDQYENELILQMADSMQIIEKDGIVYGRAMIYCKEHSVPTVLEGSVVVGGFSTSTLLGVVGVLIGKSIQVSREKGIPVIENEVLQSWLNNQLDYIVDKRFDKKIQRGFAEVFGTFGIRTKLLCIAKNNLRYLNYEELYNWVLISDFTEYILVDEYAIAVRTYQIPAKLKVHINDNVIMCSDSDFRILYNNSDDNWPQIKSDKFVNGTIQSMVINAILDAWDIDASESSEHIMKSTIEEQYSAVIGKIGGEEWQMNSIVKLWR